MLGSLVIALRRLPVEGHIRAKQTGAAVAQVQRALRQKTWSDLLLFGSLPLLTLSVAFVSLLVPMLLGPARYGQYSLVEALFRYGAAFDLGLAVLVDRQMPTLLATAGSSEQGAFASSLLWLRLYVGAAVLGISALVLFLLSMAGVLQFTWLLGMTAVAAGVFAMLTNGPASIERARAQRRAFVVRYASALAVLAFGRLAGIIAGGVMGCFAMMAISYCAVAFGPYRRTLANAGGPGMASSGIFLRESLPLFFANYTYTLLSTANRWVIASRTDQVSLGQFAFGTSGLMVIASVLGGLAQLWYPQLAKSRAAGDVLAVSKRILRDLSALACALSLAAMMGIVIGPWLINQIYPKFNGAEGVVRILLVSAPGFAIASWIVPLALATGIRPWTDGVAVYSVVLVLLVALTEAGFEIGGVGGASWGLAISMPVLVALQLWRLQRREVLLAGDAALLAMVVVLATVTPSFLVFLIQIRY